MACCPVWTWLRDERITENGCRKSLPKADFFGDGSDQITDGLSREV